jgi:mRNA interferase MazF
MKTEMINLSYLRFLKKMILEIEINQYQIVLVNLDPTIGSEMKKTRPCVVISPDEMNRHLQTIVIAPMTSSSKSYPTRIEVKHNKTRGWIVLDQIRSIDRRRIVKTFQSLTEKEIYKLKMVMQQTYVD